MSDYKQGWDDHRCTSLITAPVVYAAVAPDLVRVGREHGYAIALHGSMVRDMDVVAVPWVDGADAPEVLVERIRAALGATYGQPTERPHGRRSWVITLGGGAYIDLSVMPRRAASTQQQDPDGRLGHG